MIARWLCGAVIAAGLSSAAHASPCHDKRMLEAFLKQEHGLSLHSWGLNNAGAMVELWLAPNGLFAVVTTTPAKCSTVEIPADLHGRLWTPPSPNRAIPPADQMNNGQGL
jgi:hypothetical protein